MLRCITGILDSLLSFNTKRHKIECLSVFDSVSYEETHYGVGNFHYADSPPLECIYLCTCTLSIARRRRRRWVRGGGTSAHRNRGLINWTWGLPHHILTLKYYVCTCIYTCMCTCIHHLVCNFIRRRGLLICLRWSEWVADRFRELRTIEGWRKCFAGAHTAFSLWNTHTEGLGSGVTHWLVAQVGSCSLERQKLCPCYVITLYPLYVRSYSVYVHVHTCTYTHAHTYVRGNYTCFTIVMYVRMHYMLDWLRSWYTVYMYVHCVHCTHVHVHDWLKCY